MKEWEKHRDEMVQLYQVHKLGVVMDIMTHKYGFKACRRSYMEHFSKWNVRKYNRSPREVVVHNNSSAPSDDYEDDDDAPIGAVPHPRYGDPAGRGPQANASQTLSIPYGHHYTTDTTSNHDPYSQYAVVGAAVHDQQQQQQQQQQRQQQQQQQHHQQQPHHHQLHTQHPGQLEHGHHQAIGQQDWSELPNGGWPPSHGMEGYDTGLGVADQYLTPDGHMNGGLDQAALMHDERPAHQPHHSNQTSFRLLH